MSKFTDTSGREWAIVVNVEAVKACRLDLDIDLCDLPIDLKLLQRLRTDEVLLVNTLYVLCRKQCDAAGVSAVQFGESFTGDILEQAEEALWSALTPFFRKEKRELLTKALEAVKAMEAAALQVVREALTPEAQAELIERDRQKVLAALQESSEEIFTGDASS